MKKNNYIRDLDNEEIEEIKYYKSLFKKILSIHSNDRYYIIKRPLSEVIEKLNIAEHIL